MKGHKKKTTPITGPLTKKHRLDTLGACRRHVRSTESLPGSALAYGSDYGASSSAHTSANAGDDVGDPSFVLARLHSHAPVDNHWLSAQWDCRIIFSQYYFISIHIVICLSSQGLRACSSLSQLSSDSSQGTPWTGRLSITYKDSQPIYHMMSHVKKWLHYFSRHPCQLEKRA